MARAATTDPRIGTELAGYRIEALIGRGGMSTVYRAEDLTLRRKVALKLMSDELSQDESFQERFRAEWRLAASIDHPNVIPIYEAGEAAGQLFIAMRYVEGTDLKELLKTTGALEPQRALNLVSQAAAGLDAAHKRGLVHRDIKPSNVLIAKDDTEELVYLADFGLTKPAHSQDEAMASITLSGSADYVSPEQISEGTPKASSDIYSLGALLYETLTGQVPFPREQELQVLWAHLDEPPPRPSEANPELPNELDTVIATAMAKEPAERYATGAELAAAAQTALPTSRFSRRTLVLLALLLTTLLAAAIAIPAVLLTGGEEQAVPGEPTLDISVDSIQRIDPETNELVATVPLDFGVGGIALTDEAAWVIEADEGRYTLHRIDPETNTAVASASIVGSPYGPSRGIGGVTELGKIASDSGSVWVATSDRVSGSLGGPNDVNATVTQFDRGAAGSTGPTLLPITPSRVSSNPLPIGRAAHQSGQAGRVGALWVTSPLGRSVIRVDLAIGGGRATEIELEQPPFDVAVGEGAIWVTQFGAVLRIDPQSGEVVKTIPLDFVPVDIEVGEAAVWIADAAGDRILKIDPVVDEVVTTFEVGDEPRTISMSQGSLWVANTRDETVARIDAITGETLALIEVGARPEDLVVGESGVWVAVHPLGRAAEPLSEEEYTEALRRLDAWWSSKPFDYRDGREGLIEDLIAVTPPPSWASDHALLVQLASVRVELVERLNDAVDAGDVDAAVEILPSGQGAITDIRKEMSYDFRLMSSLHVTGTGSLSRCRHLGACDPASLLADYEDALNAGDTDRAVALYAEDAVMIGHPRDEDETADVEEIRRLEDRESEGGGTVTTYLNIEVDGSLVAFDLEFNAFSFEGGCGAWSGNEVTVEDGKITRYVWGVEAACE